MNCRHCSNLVDLTVVDLGSAPPSNAYLTQESLRVPETWFPLKVLVCVKCWLVQTEDYADADALFDSNYAYFSGFSTSWLVHAERYVADVVARFGLDRSCHIVEVAANDGYLLQYVRAREIPCTGIEPTASTAAAARIKGIDIVEDFFGTRLATELLAEGKSADLMAANNVLAHVPDINDFVAAFAILLKPHGVATFEFPHLLRLIENSQFDTIYHEHYSYLSLTAVERIFLANGLAIFDVEQHPTHGGSLRVFAQRLDTGQYKRGPAVAEMIALEEKTGVKTRQFYAGLQSKAQKIKLDFLEFLIAERRKGKQVVAYGAAAKGNTLMNFSGIRNDLISFVVDRNPAKQGGYMPGSRIAIVDESRLQQDRPDYVVILPWNLRDEISAQLEYIKAWGGRFVTAIPELEIFL